MPETIDPLKIQNLVKLGFDRMDRFCKARALFFKSYVGQYYREEKGLEGEEPLNLVFNTIRSYVPNLVAQSPITLVTTPYVEHKQYAELLGMGLDTTARQIKLKQTLRAWVTNALFAWGITRTGLKASGELLQIDDVYIDNGQVYTRCVMLDNFGFDPTCTNIDEARCLFDMVTIPRQWLLDTDGMDHDLIKGLPSSGSNYQNPLSDMTRSKEAKDAMTKLQDEVDVVQMFVPETQQIVLMGDPRQALKDRFIKISEFNGPKEGPYTFLSYSPPVEGNPFPVAPVSIWYDLACIANRIMKKEIDQIEQQKDVGLFNPAMASEVDDIKEAQTGDWIPTTDPKGVNVVSIGGQNPKNDAALNAIFMWYNMMSGNPTQMQGGTTGNEGDETATKTMALQGNMSVGINDMQDITYDATSEIMRKMAWYLHTDPFIQLPMTKRVTGGEEKQLVLTPELRMGDFFDFTFTIKSRSMTKMDPMVRSKRILEFCTNVIPAGATTAQTLIMIGQPFNLNKYYTQIAIEWGIGDWVEELLVDPEFQNKLKIMLALGPQNPGKSKSPNTQAGIQQNGGAPMNMAIPTVSQENNAAPQAVAAIGQSVNQGVV
jgi:hypothetical protein